MRSRSRSVKPSLYKPVPFYTIRFVGILSAFVVAIILAVFIYNLHDAGRKLPWAFLVLLIASLLSFLNFFFTTALHCCYGLSPRLSLTTNTILLILWLISLGLLSWSMSHTILTSCTTTYWGTNTGITVCRTYKALFAFTILGSAAHIAHAILDIVTRNHETRLGAYDPMDSTNAFDYKMHDRNGSVLSDPYANASEDLHPLYRGENNPHAQAHDDPYNTGYSQPFVDARTPAAAPPAYNSALEGYHASEAEEFSQRRAPRVRFNPYETGGYMRPTEQTGYDPAAYR